MKSGIIGLPGAGKSTVFDALTRSPADAAHRGEDRIGTVKVPDARVDVLSDMYRPKKTTYAQVEYFLPGAQSRAREGKSEQSGWSAVRDCDALIHVARNCAAYGLEAPSPWEDVAALDQELMLSDLVVVEKRLERIANDRQRGKAVDGEEPSLLERCKEALEAEKPLRHLPELADAPPLRGFAFMSAKPMLILFNNDDEDEHLPAARNGESTEACQVIRAKLEQEIAQMSSEEAAEFLAEFNIAESALGRVIKATYDLMGLASFFTVGDDEVKAWTVRRDTAALEAAGVIHSDIQKGFIRAEVLAYDDLMAAGSYAEARKRGTVRLEGKTYGIQDGDIAHFRFNV